MKNQLHNLIIISIVLLLGLSSCATSATPLAPSQTVSPPTNTPKQLPPSPVPMPTLPAVCQSLESHETLSDLSGEEVVVGMVERLNAGDVTGAMAYFAEDARFYILSIPPVAYEENFGNEAICRTWANYVNDKLEWNITILTLNNIESGELITARSTIWLDSYLQLGAEPIELKESVLVKDGKIVEYSRWLTKESLAQLRTVLPSSYFLRPESAPGISSTTPGSEFDVIFSDNSCVYNGPAIWQAGYLDINVEVKDDAHKYALVFVYLQEGTDIFDIAVSHNVHDVVGARETSYEFAPKENTTIKHLVGGDRMFLMCFTVKPTHGPGGLFGPFEVRSDTKP
ncbi:MAG TPA: nuclear transport factor 2 family protein [Anaerolineales bacterium]|nr:nuclear transport factor 2 family protein [Anaerolineales bacterium]